MKVLFGLIICFYANTVFATCTENSEMRFNSITLTVPPSSTSTLVVLNGSTVSVAIDGGLRNGGDWDSTDIAIVGISTRCFNNPGNNDTVNGNTWVNRVKTFTFTTPSVTGIYQLTITMYRDDNCTGCSISHTITFGVGLVGPTGPAGQDGVDGTNGENGQNGLNGANGVDGQNGTNCTVVENEDGSATITCGEESTTIYPGQDGSPGLDCFDLNGNGQGDLCDPEALYEFGDCSSFREYCQNGGNEEDIVITDTNAKLIRASKQIFNCTFTEDVNGDGLVNTLDCNGGQGQPGEPGNNGTNGSNGSNGMPGSSCSVMDNYDDTFTMSCDDGSYVTWHNGENGQAGPQGQMGNDGPQGVVGPSGPQGQAGTDGVQCSSSTNEDGTTTIVCGENSFILGDVNTNAASVPPPQGGICGSIDIITLLAGLAVGAGAGLVRKH